MINFKKIFQVFLVISIILFFTNAVFAESNNEALLEKEAESKINVSLDTKNIVFKNAIPVIINGRTLVPLRDIFESMDCKVSWEGETRTVTAVKDENVIVLSIDNKLAKINDDIIELDVAPTIINSSTMVPVRFIAESLGAKVDWDASSKTVIITSNPTDEKNNEVVVFNDINLETVVRDKINKPTGDILRNDLHSIEYLDASGEEIISIEGIQYLSNINTLILSENNITDISPLASLKSLKVLSLNNNLIKDIEPVSSLENLNELYVSNNQIIDINSLANLKNLTTLNIYYNAIIDISSLTMLNNLADLYLENLNIKSDINSALFLKYENLNKIVDDIIKDNITSEMSDIEKEMILHDYIVNNTDYDLENYNSNSIPKVSHTHLGVFLNHKAVCDGYARAMYILLNKAGIETNIIVGESVGLSGWENHAWNIVKIDNKYYHLDVTWDDPVVEDDFKILSHRYFNLSDAQFLSDHKWEISLYPNCNTDKLNFTTKSKYKDLIEDGWIYSNVNGELYKISINGDERIKLSEEDATYITLNNDWLYYVSYDTDLCKIKTDGTNRSIVKSDSKAMDLAIHNNWLYYLDREKYKIHRLNLEDGAVMSVGTEAVSTWFKIDEGWIYYKGYNWTDDAKIYKISALGSKKSALSNDKPSGFQSEGRSVRFSLYEDICILDGWIYYINDYNNKYLYKIKLDGTERTKINDEPTFDFEIVDGYIYFLDEDFRYYRINSDGSNKIKFTSKDE